MHVFNYCVCIVYSLAVFHQSIIERGNRDDANAKLPDGSYDDVTVVDVARIDKKGNWLTSSSCPLSMENYK